MVLCWEWFGDEIGRNTLNAVEAQRRLEDGYGYKLATGSFISRPSNHNDDHHIGRSAVILLGGKGDSDHWLKSVCANTLLPLGRPGHGMAQYGAVHVQVASPQRLGKRVRT
ncbi:MAG: hypothetical protein CL912_17575 [Deltaproteobacteria bacterium]|nr:hypothetical protein [Deltaproteobacteria bacterium]